jgi:hypothetical protein
LNTWFSIFVKFLNHLLSILQSFPLIFWFIKKLMYNIYFQSFLNILLFLLRFKTFRLNLFNICLFLKLLIWTQSIFLISNYLRNLSCVRCVYFWFCIELILQFCLFDIILAAHHIWLVYFCFRLFYCLIEWLTVFFWRLHHFLNFIFVQVLKIYCFIIFIETLPSNWKTVIKTILQNLIWISLNSFENVYHFFYIIFIIIFA